MLRLINSPQQRFYVFGPQTICSLRMTKELGLRLRYQKWRQLSCRHFQIINLFCVRNVFQLVVFAVYQQFLPVVLVGKLDLAVE